MPLLLCYDINISSRFSGTNKRNSAGGGVRRVHNNVTLTAASTAMAACSRGMAGGTLANSSATGVPVSPPPSRRPGPRRLHNGPKLDYSQWPDIVPCIVLYLPRFYLGSYCAKYNMRCRRGEFCVLSDTLVRVTQRNGIIYIIYVYRIIPLCDYCARVYLPIRKSRSFCTPEILFPTFPSISTD